jgi:hypothetical protein
LDVAEPRPPSMMAVSRGPQAGPIASRMRGVQVRRIGRCQCYFTVASCAAFERTDGGNVENADIG